MDTAKILIVMRNRWNDTLGGTDTVSNFFQGYDSEKMACIYIESKRPIAKCCRYHFQISEYSLIRKLFKWNTKTGFVTDMSTRGTEEIDDAIVEKENTTMNYVRGHRSFFYTFMREILWAFNGWKSKELKAFLHDYNPDVVWFFGSPLILMNRLFRFIQEETRVRSAIFLMDDAYTFLDRDKKPIRYLVKSWLRKSIKQVITNCSKVYVISPKMKKEYDDAFGIDSCFITKGIDFSHREYKPIDFKMPVRMVYMGQIIYGRIYSLISIAKSIERLNNNGIKIRLDIYTTNPVADNMKDSLLSSDGVRLVPPVPGNEVERTLSNYDVVVFVESFEPKTKDLARLSFSTKLTDYLGSGKCILAMGPDDIAPIEYLRDNDAAIIVSSEDELDDKLKLLLDKDTLISYSKKAYQCARRNHDKEEIRSLIFNQFINNHESITPC